MAEVHRRSRRAPITRRPFPPSASSQRSPTWPCDHEARSTLIDSQGQGCPKVRRVPPSCPPTLDGGRGSGQVDSRTGKRIGTPPPSSKVTARPCDREGLRFGHVGDATLPALFPNRSLADQRPVSGRGGGASGVKRCGRHVIGCHGPCSRTRPLADPTIRPSRFGLGGEAAICSRVARPAASRPCTNPLRGRGAWGEIGRGDRCR